jgi:hypothetical protein
LTKRRFDKKAKLTKNARSLNFEMPNLESISTPKPEQDSFRLELIFNEKPEISEQELRETIQLNKNAIGAIKIIKATKIKKKIASLTKRDNYDFAEFWVSEVADLEIMKGLEMNHKIAREEFRTRFKKNI